MKYLNRIVIFLLVLVLTYCITNAHRIYQYSFEYSEERSDVAIVLGAGTDNGVLSPVLKKELTMGYTSISRGWWIKFYLQAV